MVSKKNRVDPFGNIVNTPARGTLMGNRGCLHDSHGRLISQRWTRKAWVSCRLSFNGRQRQVMAPGKYTELFFLDEAASLAAGHRPCATCRRGDYSRFKQFWEQVHKGEEKSTIKDIDERLHQERFISSGWQNEHFSLNDLPDGAFVVLDDPSSAWLVWGNELMEWSPEGYHNHMQRPDDLPVTLLTPRSVVSVLAAGYVPDLHPSAGINPVPKAVKNTKPTLKRMAPKVSIPKSSASTEDSETLRSTLNATVPAVSLYKLRKTPAGKALYTYFAAILHVTGMDQGKVYPLKKFLGNFSGHVDAGRIKKMPDGYLLTSKGLDYFNDRYNPGNSQYVDRADVKALGRLIRSGGGDDWVLVG